jgi:hypothetical protein
MPAAAVTVTSFRNLPALATHLRDELQTKKFVLLYANNGTEKTRLSTEFKDLGKQFDADGRVTARDTLYFNAFTEDLFHWDNDFENDELRVLELNAKSTFFDGLGQFEIENRVRTLLNRYADFEFNIDLTYDEKGKLQAGRAMFGREIIVGEGASARSETAQNIKISRGEESIFIWCFFLAIIEIALDPQTTAYDWVKYIYIDDPMSSLDEQNVVMVATHLAAILKEASDPPGVVISTHHPLFHNVLWNELKKASRRYFLSLDHASNSYSVRNTEATPFFHHIAALIDLYEIDRAGTVNTYHFNMLRAIAEKTASFLGYGNFGDCIKRDANDLEGRFHARLLNLLSHGGYSLYEPTEMQDDNKSVFGPMLHRFIRQHAFNAKHFPGLKPEGSENKENK